MGKVHPEVNIPQSALPVLAEIEEVFEKKKAGTKQLRIAWVNRDTKFEAWGHGSGGLLKKITVAKARCLLAHQEGKGAELKPKPSGCGLCCFVCGCSNKMPVHGAEPINLAGTEQAFRNPVLMVVAGMPDGAADLRILGEILTESGYAKDSSGVWSPKPRGGPKPVADMKR